MYICIYIYIGWYLFQNDIFLRQHEQINWHHRPWTSAFFSGFCCCFPRALGFLMIQNILCFTSGIVNALCIIDMGPLALNKRSCFFFFLFSTCFQKWQESGNVKTSDWQQLRFLLLPTLSAVNASMIVKDPTDRVYLKLLPLVWIIQEWMQNAISPAWLINLAQMERFHWTDQCLKGCCWADPLFWTVVRYDGVSSER